MIKSAILLCAGKSSRFGENKLYTKFFGKTLPEYAIDFCIMNKIEKIYVTLNKQDVYCKDGKLSHPIIDNINETIKEQIDYIIKVSYAFQNEEEYGPAAAIKVWQKEITDDVIVLFGDNYYYGYLPKDIVIQDATAYASYKSFPINPRNLQYAAIIKDYIIEKPHAFIEGNYFCGFIILSKEVFEQKKCDSIQVSSRNEYEITDLFNSIENRKFISLDESNIAWSDLTYKGDINTMKEVIKMSFGLK